MGDMAEDQMLHIDAGEEDLKLDGHNDFDTRSEASTVSSIRNKSTAHSPDRPSKSGSSRQYDYITKLNYLFRDTRFFIIKSGNEENIAISKSRSVWSTLPANETKLNQAYRECRNVMLVFSVKESGKFSGFARLAGESRRDVSPVPWVLPYGINARALGSVFKVDWICRKELPFAATTHLLNEWNEMKPVKIGRDGQEVEPKAAEALLRLFPEDGEVDMTPILRKSKQASRKTKRGNTNIDKTRGRPRPSPRRTTYRPVLPQSRFRLPVFNGIPRNEGMRRAEEIAYMHGLPPLPYGPPGMYPPLGFDMEFAQPSLPRYYDGVPSMSQLPSLMPQAFIAAHEKRSYDRSVDEFLHRTRPRQRERSRSPRGRSRSRSLERVQARENFRLREKGRDVMQPRDRERREREERTLRRAPRPPPPPLPRMRERQPRLRRTRSHSRSRSRGRDRRRYR